MKFVEFPKIPRLNRDCVITEKIDGTNAQIYIVSKEELLLENQEMPSYDIAYKDGFHMFAGSRNRWLHLGKDSDNYGFAQWAKTNSDELFKLGEGHHFGEWWGNGIQRRYGLNEKRFSLFNTGRWKINPLLLPNCVYLVPILYEGPFDNSTINQVLKNLRVNGSVAAPGFNDPEGIVIFHIASRTLYKVTIKDDEKPKGL